MNIEEFKTELEARLIIEKEYLIREIALMGHEEKLELLGIFNGKYRDLVRKLAGEEGIDLNAPYQPEVLSEPETLTYEQIILGKTMSVYDRLSDELYEEITNV